MKRKPALIAAFLTTFVIAVAMILVGANAIFNPNSVPVSTSPTSVSANDSSGIVEVSASTSSGQVQQLQDLITQYQQREQQYQQREQQYQTAVKRRYHAGSRAAVPAPTASANRTYQDWPEWPNLDPTPLWRLTFPQKYKAYYEKQTFSFTSKGMDYRCQPGRIFLRLGRIWPFRKTGSRY